jgi:hypothetical protein
LLLFPEKDAGDGVKGNDKPECRNKILKRDYRDCGGKRSNKHPEQPKDKHHGDGMLYETPMNMGFICQAKKIQQH